MQSDWKPEPEQSTSFTPYTPSASLSKPSRSLLPSPPTIQPRMRSLARALANKFTLQRCPQSRETNRLSRKVPTASVIFQQRPLILALFNPMSNSCQYLSRRHYRHFRTMCPKVTGFVGVFVVFYLLLLFCFKVMSLSPFNGECATWLIMYFQNCRFSDKGEGIIVIPRPPQEVGRKVTHRSTSRLRT